ncbi:DUF202 domain-containing protein [Cellulomonas shaoxiangyii]|uniref:DUF202 domain-containing protein n=1 Tax=Cellulomonas shaoxiangyii TaxID=2566013 RepID=A0A4P7SMV7_9CELL|nr:DUF202 domain-containing protein [Cellulomonas shaoxiangyii]QCB94204.1 DUF202 domain-containing protein [Cellulomonas shaoxiangyii]TGY86697.1 DUF202 domain-containing protein [Cellulomonas shaoxiangyii]
MTGVAADSLAGERTALAWRRTALGLLGGSVAAGRLLAETWGPAGWSVAAGGTLLAVLVLVASHERRSAARHGSDGRSTPGGRLVTACAAGLVAVGAAAAAIVLTWRH